MAAEQGPEIRRESAPSRETQGEAVERKPMDIAKPAPAEPVQAPYIPTIDKIADAPAEKSPSLIKVESVLEEGLADIFYSLPDDKKEEFKQKGEEAAKKIDELLNAAKVSAKKIFDVLKEWLSLVPGVNKFYLSQEAKIKTDKLLLISEQEKKARSNQIS